jgi:hypothetical protein
MKHASALMVSALALLIGTGCTQAPAPCQIQTGEYVVRLTPTGTQAGCPAEFGDVWFFQPYLDVQQNVLIIGISETLGLPDTDDPDYKNSPLYGKANFTSVDPDANDLCTIEAMSFSDTTTGTSYAVSAMHWLSTARYLGTEFEADVTYTTPTCAGGTYKAQAINPPFIGCTSNADCDPFSQPLSSGINSDYDQGCTFDAWATDITGDPAEGICFFNEPFPSLGGFQTTP